VPPSPPPQPAVDGALLSGLRECSTLVSLAARITPPYILPPACRRLVLLVCARIVCAPACVALGRLLGRDRFKAMQDAYCGVCILALYFLYLMVVKGALSVFDCSPVRCCLPAEPVCRGPVFSCAGAGTFAASRTLVARIHCGFLVRSLSAVNVLVAMGCRSHAERVWHSNPGCRPVHSLRRGSTRTRRARTLVPSFCKRSCACGPPSRKPRCVVAIIAPQAGGVHERLKPAAALSLVGYAVGLPLAFLVLLVKHRASIIADQALRVAGQGGTEATNPYFHIRMQFQELYRCRGGRLCVVNQGSRYFADCGVAMCCTAALTVALPSHPLALCVPSLFRPELYWWRLVLVLRKFCIVGVALMFSSTPLFQAWCVAWVRSRPCARL
jgi:hypothetical protein